MQNPFHRLCCTSVSKTKFERASMRVSENIPLEEEDEQNAIKAIEDLLLLSVEEE